MYDKENTLIILDWDDTLFPTSWTMNNDISLSNSDNIGKYKIIYTELDNVLCNFLYKCLSLGRVVIVSNASTQWIKASSKILPYTQKLLLDQILVLSARELYQHVPNMSLWKDFTFKNTVSSFFHHKQPQNIVSIGDAEYEYAALVQLYNWNPNKKRLLKNIKFMKTPDYHTLIDQLTVLNKYIQKICKKRKHVDLLFKNIN